MRPQPDWSLYLVTDRTLMGGRAMEEVVLSAVRGGAGVVQLREKNCSTREFVALARSLKARLAPFGTPLIINDRVDVALACGADGVHLGQSDMEYADARRILGPGAIIGVSIERPEQSAPGADYLGVGPIFATPTKPDAAPPWGLEALAAYRRTTRQILIAIGGIHAGNARQVIDAGADGVAVVSAICAAADPEAAARALRAAIKT
jgi:thiamine-phosphate pyrophosphorylase